MFAIKPSAIPAALRLFILALALTCGGLSTASAQNTQPQHAQAVSESIWQVTSSWSGPFYWVFWDNGRYQDTDGPAGAFEQHDTMIIMRADSGWTYQATISGDTMSGSVYSARTGESAGTFVAQRVRPGT